MTISIQLDETQKGIIAIHRRLFEESLSPMKLQKLCYYAQGYRLAEDAEQFPENFQAWQHGPVIPGLYMKYKSYGWKQIEVVSEAVLGSDPFLTDVVAAYGRFDGAALSTMTHREEPWIRARGGIPENDGSVNVIEKNVIKSYFKRLLADG